MSILLDVLNKIFSDDIEKIIVSKAANKSEKYNKLVINQLEKNNETYFQISSYTNTQVFHENIDAKNIVGRLNELVGGHYRQINGFGQAGEHIVLISKSGDCNYKLKKNNAVNNLNTTNKSHNKKKNYILEEGSQILPLVDMGVFTKDGKIVNSMYDKYRQINRFIEIIDDEISEAGLESLNIIDFGCGKSYLTFIVYYYFTEIKKINVNMIGLDLKADVIEKCNASAKKYGYDNLHFEVGDINGFKAPFDVDMVITLHACDMATDYALYNAITWNAKFIFSVPCCQHQLNSQNAPESLTLLSRYGIIKERFSALATDAIRANLLEYKGYKTQLLEFIDFDHTPKNILIRAVKKPMGSKASKEKALNEVKQVMKEFSFNPKLYELLDIKE